MKQSPANWHLYPEYRSEFHIPQSGTGQQNIRRRKGQQMFGKTFPVRTCLFQQTVVFFSQNHHHRRRAQLPLENDRPLRP